LRKLEDAEPDATGATRSALDGRVRFVQFYTASYKGRAGKRHIKKTYVNGSERSQTNEQAVVSLDEEEVRQNTKESPMNDDTDGHATNLEELHFCKLARQTDGEIDPLWKKITVATNDEINAHTILFMPGPHFDNLVQQTCNEVAVWVSDGNP
jgi:hypothetical protein